MSLRNILKSRAFNLLLKSMSSTKSKSLIGVRNRYPFVYNIVRTIPVISKYFCFAFLNIFYVAEAEDLQSNKTDGDLEAVIAKADELFFVGKYQDILSVLKPYQDSNNVEVLWRIARTLYNLSKKKGIKSSENAALINEAYEYIEKALNLEKNHYAIHKWMAILIDAKSALEGIRIRIQNLPVFKEHLMAAIELNPKDATSVYMLGQFMYNIADMSWVQKTIAKALFGTPPEATFEEAFYYFSRAEEVDPNFYSANLLMLGKTCLKLKKTEAGCYWLRCARAYPVRTDEDEAVRLEAEELLRKYQKVRHAEKDKTQNFESSS